MAASKHTAVMLCSLTVDQNSSVRKWVSTTHDPPVARAMLMNTVPPTWNRGRLTKVRSSPSNRGCASVPIEYP